MSHTCRRRSLALVGLAALATSCAGPTGPPADATPRCEVHQAPLVAGTAPVVYGLPLRPSLAYADARRRSFPHAATSVAGGCIGGGEEERAAVRYCPACRDAAAAFAAAGR